MLRLPRRHQGSALPPRATSCRRGSNSTATARVSGGWGRRLCAVLPTVPAVGHVAPSPLRIEVDLSLAPEHRIEVPARHGRHPPPTSVVSQLALTRAKRGGDVAALRVFLPPSLHRPLPPRPRAHRRDHGAGVTAESPLHDTTNADGRLARHRIGHARLSERERPLRLHSGDDLGHALVRAPLCRQRGRAVAGPILLAVAVLEGCFVSRVKARMGLNTRRCVRARVATARRSARAFAGVSRGRAGARA